MIRVWLKMYKHPPVSIYVLNSKQQTTLNVKRSFEKCPHREALARLGADELLGLGLSGRRIWEICSTDGCHGSGFSPVFFWRHGKSSRAGHILRFLTR